MMNILRRFMICLLLLLVGIFFSACGAVSNNMLDTMVSGHQTAAQIDETQPTTPITTNQVPSAQSAKSPLTKSPSPSMQPTSAPSPSPQPTSAPSSSPKPTLPPVPAKALRHDIKAIYLTSWSAGNNLETYIELIEETELNAVVIDIREGDGKVAYPTTVDVFKDNKGFRKDYDPAEVIRKLHEKDIYVIGRLVAFKDSFLPRIQPELAILKSNGQPLSITEPNGSKSYWMNPANEDSWEYLADLTAEAVALGFDEIQFDYVRFPETTLFRYDLGDDTAPRHTYIEGFLAFVRERVPDAVLSADIFGVPCIFTEDLGDIGQILESIGKSIDFVSPMVYPSHYCSYTTGNMYGNVWTLFQNHESTIKGEVLRKPDKAPYETVYNSLVIARERIKQVEGYGLGVRPYLQGFTMTSIKEGSYMTYGKEAYRKQIDAVYDAGYTSWIFWNARNEYPNGAFLAE